MVVQMSQNYSKINYIFKNKICTYYTSMCFTKTIFFSQKRLYLKKDTCVPFKKIRFCKKKKIHSAKTKFHYVKQFHPVKKICSVEKNLNHVKKKKKIIM